MPDLPANPLPILANGEGASAGKPRFLMFVVGKREALACCARSFASLHGIASPLSMRQHGVGPCSLWQEGFWLYAVGQHRQIDEPERFAVGAEIAHTVCRREDSADVGVAGGDGAPAEIAAQRRLLVADGADEFYRHL